MHNNCYYGIISNMGNIQSNNIKTIYGNQRQALIYSYLAGLLDGEGTIVCSKSKLNGEKYKNWNPVYTNSIAIKMTNRKAIELFNKTFNKKIKICNYKSRVPHYKTIYGCEVSGRHSIDFVLKTLLPYLLVKRLQAEAMIEFHKGTGEYLKQKKLNSSKKRICKLCKRKKKLHSFQLCHNCYMRLRRNKTIDKYREPKSKNHHCYVSKEELSRREDFHRKMKKLNSA